MGLDQYLHKLKPVDNKNTIEDEGTEIAYWRKHPNLQGYMENLWRTKTGNTDSDFNCVNLVLTREDLLQWKKVCKSGKYPPTSGFFFGSNSDEEYKEYDLKTIDEALKTIDEGYIVYYRPWW